MAFPLSQLYADARFSTLTKFYDRLQFETTQSRYTWWVIDSDGKPLNQYGEVAEGQGEPVFAPHGTLVAMRVILEPEKQTLERYGIQHPRAALVEHCVAHLAAIALVPKIGDRFDFNLEQYEIMGDGDEGFIWNQKNPLRVVMGANKAQRIKAV